VIKGKGHEVATFQDQDVDMDAPPSCPPVLIPPRRKVVNRGMVDALVTEIASFVGGMSGEQGSSSSSASGGVGSECHAEGGGRVSPPGTTGSPSYILYSKGGHARRREVSPIGEQSGCDESISLTEIDFEDSGGVLEPDQGCALQ
jgi:hypothetical protein